MESAAPTQTAAEAIAPVLKELKRAPHLWHPKGLARHQWKQWHERARRRLGPAGEVSNASLASAIGGTSNNSNGVGTLGQSADPNYQQSQIQDLINKVDELINALRR